MFMANQSHNGTTRQAKTVSSSRCSILSTPARLWLPNKPTLSCLRPLFWPLHTSDDGSHFLSQANPAFWDTLCLVKLAVHQLCNPHLYCSSHHTVSDNDTAVQSRHGREHTAPLLDAECARLLDGDWQFLKQFLKRRVRRQVQTVEACVSSVQTSNHYHSCDS